MQSCTGNIGPIPLLLSALASLVMLGTLVGGCGSTRRGALTAKDIAEHGTMTVEASKESVFHACVVALQMAGYAMEVAEPDTGIVVTRPRRVDEAEPGAGGRLSHRGYLVEVKSLGGSTVRVTATPTAGDDRVDRRAWDLDRERAAWERLFADVRSLVDRERDTLH